MWQQDCRNIGSEIIARKAAINVTVIVINSCFFWHVFPSSPQLAFLQYLLTHGCFQNKNASHFFVQISGFDFTLGRLTINYIRIISVTENIYSKPVI
jgi:hypothetical protein